DPTEAALLESAAELGERLDPARRDQDRVVEFHFDPALKRMSTIDRCGDTLRINLKGAPEAVLPRCATMLGADSSRRPMDPDARNGLAEVVDAYARDGLRVLAFADRDLGIGEAPPDRREDAERDLCFLGLAALLDPPRPEVADAVARCHTAGIRI